MRVNGRKRWGLLLVAAACVGVPAEAFSVKIERRYPRGQELYSESRMVVRQHLKGGPFGKDGVRVSLSRVLGTYEAVRKSSSRGAEVRYTFERAAAELRGPLGMHEAYDTDASGSESGGDLGAALEGLLGKSYSVRYDAEDEIDEVEGLDEIGAVFKPLAGDNPALGLIAVELDDGFYEESRNYHHCLFFPKRRVEVGTTWACVDQIEVPGAGKVGVRYNCELVRFERKEGGSVAVIKFTGGLAQDVGNQLGRGPEGLDLSLKKARMIGRAKFDFKAGHYIEQIARAEFTFDARGEIKGQQVYGVEVTIGFEQRQKRVPASERKKE